MAVLVRLEEVEVHRPAGTTDEHGWVAPPVGGTPYGTLMGTIQPERGLAGSYSPAAGPDGGFGPHSPKSSARATGYFDEGADVLPGDVLLARSGWWQVESVNVVLDPRPSGELDCTVVYLSSLWGTVGA